jgi:hypothetical protein
MTVDQAATAWESMLAAANDLAPVASRRRTVGRHAAVVVRTSVLLILASLAILVLLPAALAAQAAFAG